MTKGMDCGRDSAISFPCRVTKKASFPVSLVVGGADQLKLM